VPPGREQNARPGPLKVDRAYQELRRMIVTHELPPGTPLDERELIERLGTGRTPLREAILRLAQERLIVRSPRRGAWVSQLSLSDIQQLNEARLLIEPQVARLAASHITPTAVERLRMIMARTEEPVANHDFEPISRADLDFHILLGGLSGNEYLTHFSLEINTALLRYWHLSFRRGDSSVVWYESHLTLANLICAGDVDGAEREAFRHIDSFRARMREFML
jgi:DNA-binding GntR family transcriptional regulator